MSEIKKDKLKFKHKFGYAMGDAGGCGHEKHFDGPKWPLHNVIAVTINYRLGPLVFFWLKELNEKDGKTGNYGLYDQLTAINWIKNSLFITEKETKIKLDNSDDEKKEIKYRKISLFDED